MAETFQKTAATFLLVVGMITAGMPSISPGSAEEFHAIPAPASDAAPSQ